MPESPTQEEIDNVAHFVEAVRELRRSPFFIEEYKNLSISAHQVNPKEDIEGHFPDHNIVEAAIIPFRRVWQKSEPCYYIAITNILKKYIPKYRSFLDSILSYENRSAIKLMPFFRDINLSFADVIDVWFNTKYLHIGKSAREGRFNREDFERFNNQFGPVLFEFYFLLAMEVVGICFFNILQRSEYFLKNLAQRNLVHSFQFRTDDASKNIERRTPGFTPNPDSPEQRVWRLRRRRQYRVISKLLDITNCSDMLAAKLINDCISFDEFVRCFKVRLEYTNDLTALNKDDIVLYDHCSDNEKTEAKNCKMRKGLIAQRYDGSIVWSEDSVPILQDQYVEFRDAMMAEHFK